MAGAKTVIKGKNQFFHACQLREEIFEIYSNTGLIFTTVCLNFEHLFHFSAGTNQDGYQSKVAPEAYINLP